MAAYTPLQSHRKSSMTFKKGQPVFILDDPQGTPWVMQALGQLVDKTLTCDTLKGNMRISPPSVSSSTPR